MRTSKGTTEDRLHNADSAAELLGVRPSTIRCWWAIGKLPRLKIGRLSRVYESDLLALIEPGRGRLTANSDVVKAYSRDGLR